VFLKSPDGSRNFENRTAKLAKSAKFLVFLGVLGALRGKNGEMSKNESCQTGL
jgi:hypothetical protein